MTTAHQRSAFAIVDPAYSIKTKAPHLDTPSTAWLYGECEYECWQLSQLRELVARGICHVGYPGIFHTAAETAYFRCTISVLKNIQLYAEGHCIARLNGEIIYEAKAQTQQHVFFCNNGLLELQLSADLGDLPCIGFDLPSEALTIWQWSRDKENWQSPVKRLAGKTEPAHRQAIPRMNCKPITWHAGIADFGCELLGAIYCRSVIKPSLFVGESLFEAQNQDPAAFEQRLEMHEISAGHWRSTHDLAFRYLRFEFPNQSAVPCDIESICTEAIFHPAQYRGAFACNDEQLTRMWMCSTYTLRLCMQHFLLDGIKRDRLPWTGDLAMSLLANAFSFADADLVRNSLSVLGRAGIAKSDINGITDYSLWWLIAHDFYQRYYADSEYLAREWPRICDSLDVLLSLTDSHGFLQTREQAWLFIDWVQVEKSGALQILWWWALESASRLALRCKDSQRASLYQQRAEQLAQQLQAARNQDGLWRALPTQESPISRHASIVALISGLEQVSNAAHNDVRNKQIQYFLSATDLVGTPYMKGFEMMALAKLGNSSVVLDTLRHYWGGMLDQGATTFWEAYDANEIDGKQYSFYNRPFGKSLCHAWSAGPTAILPQALLGLQPLSDGWKDFNLKPQLAELDWLAQCVPTPYGDIEVLAEHGTLTVTVPTGCTMHFNHAQYIGPQQLQLSY